MSIDRAIDFQPAQILFLEHGDRRLYAEVIQVVVSRQLCWVRPLMLVTLTEEHPQVIDVRHTSDLLWPINLFQPALDTEVLGFVCQILVKEPSSEDIAALKQFNQFIQQFWQATWR